MPMSTTTKAPSAAVIQTYFFSLSRKCSSIVDKSTELTATTGFGVVVSVLGAVTYGVDVSVVTSPFTFSACFKLMACLICAVNQNTHDEISCVWVILLI